MRLMVFHGRHIDCPHYPLTIVINLSIPPHFLPTLNAVQLPPTADQKDEALVDLHMEHRGSVPTASYTCPRCDSDASLRKLHAGEAGSSGAAIRDAFYLANTCLTTLNIALLPPTEGNVLPTTALNRSAAFALV